MSVVLGDRRAMEYVDAPVSFHDDAGMESYIYPYGPPDGLPMFSGRVDVRTVRIWNGWPQAEDFQLDVHGFAVGTTPTSFTDWYDPEAVEERYYPECVAYVMALTGADAGMAFDHNVRHAPRSDEGAWALKVAKPSNGAHNDYTDESAPKRAQELLGRVPTGRYAYVNLWRPITEPLRDSPLAVIDGRTLDRADLSLTELRYPERSGWIHRLHYNPGQRWVFFPDMAHAEALFLKCWDSRTDVRTRHTAHTGFQDPTCPEGSPPRESIEVRVLVTWS